MPGGDRVRTTAVSRRDLDHQSAQIILSEGVASSTVVRIAVST
jgi:hypothetical protein